MTKFPRALLGWLWDLAQPLVWWSVAFYCAVTGTWRRAQVAERAQLALVTWLAALALWHATWLLASDLRFWWVYSAYTLITALAFPAWCWLTWRTAADHQRTREYAEALEVELADARRSPKARAW